jgi:hypothetical protein
MSTTYKRVKVDYHVLAVLEAIKAKTGLSESEQIRRGIQMWLQAYDWTIVPVRPPEGDQTTDHVREPTWRFGDGQRPAYRRSSTGPNVSTGK